MNISAKPFGKLPNGKIANLYTLAGPGGLKLEITDYGGCMVSLFVPDRKENTQDILLGYNSLEGYLRGSCYCGAIIGRCANRISNASFTLNGREYKLSKNEGENHLHGGFRGFDKVLWEASMVHRGGGEALQLTYTSKDGEEGYPGNLMARITYFLIEDHGFEIEYFAECDRDTVISLTNHAYFNLAGHGVGDISTHELMLNANSFTVLGKDKIPTGEIRSVRGTPMDFGTYKPLKDGLFSGYEQIAAGNGYDHNWVLNKTTTRTREESGGAAGFVRDKISDEPEKAVSLYDPASGRLMEVYTTYPGIQIYTGNYLDGSETGKGGVRYNKWSGLALETQYFPDSLKHKHFPSPILFEGQKYHHRTRYIFSCK